MSEREPYKLRDVWTEHPVTITGGPIKTHATLNVPDHPPVTQSEPVALARRFHEVYERLAPQFGYETRPDTKAFDPHSANGRLMIAVCAELFAHPPVTHSVDDCMRLAGDFARAWWSGPAERKGRAEDALEAAIVACGKAEWNAAIDKVLSIAPYSEYSAEANAVRGLKR